MAADAGLRILLIDDNPDARALAALVLREEFPDSRIESIAGALDFAEALAAGAADALVLDPDLRWADGAALVDTLRRRHPACLVLGFRREGAAEGEAAWRAAGFDDWVGKDPPGFLRLGRTLRRLREYAAQRMRMQAEGRGADGVTTDILRSASVGALALDAAGTLVYANAALARMAGLPPESTLAGRSLVDVFAGLAASTPWQTVLASGQPFHAVFRPAFAAADKPSLQLDLWPLASTGAEGRRYGGLMVELRGELDAVPSADSASRVPRADRELEQLAYAVSHDLQEPLNIVTRHAQLLHERLGRQVEPEAARLLANLLAGTERMQTMVDGVLEYARAGAPSRELLPLAFDEALDEALGNLQLSLDEAGAEVLRTPLPTLPADRWAMVQVFQNLLANAIKFRGPDSPRIVIGAKERAADWRFAVRDNGIGIDPRFQERIFSLFQRLHTSEEYPGTGIGLTLCRRTVERHGGAIWVRSQPGQGATFYFTVPKAPAQGAGGLADGGRYLPPADPD